MTTAIPIRPANLGPEFIYAQVSIDGDTSLPDGIFWAWVDPTNTWNGFAQPVFDWGTARDVVAWTTRVEHDDSDLFLWVTDTVLLQVHRNGVDDETPLDQMTTVYRGPTYAIADGWCWQFVENPRYALKPGGITPQSLLTAAAGLLEPENLTLDQEYTRGICELLADTILLTREVYMDQRKDIVLDLIRQETNRG